MINLNHKMNKNHPKLKIKIPKTKLKHNQLINNQLIKFKNS
jgi:hypothetical protein